MRFLCDTRLKLLQFKFSLLNIRKGLLKDQTKKLNLPRFHTMKSTHTLKLILRRHQTNAVNAVTLRDYDIENRTQLQHDTSLQKPIHHNTLRLVSGHSTSFQRDREPHVVSHLQYDPERQSRSTYALTSAVTTVQWS
jgi:beta-xylosidase